MTVANALRTGLVVSLVAAGRTGAAPGAAPPLVPVEGDLAVEAFRFSSGETLPLLKLHYRTLGTARRDPSGKITNAVLLLHGTGGSGQNFLAPAFVTELFAPGQVLDASRYFIVMPDAVGHGQSSKPSDGLRAKFPRYDFDDMVTAQRIVLDRLGVGHIRALVGTSMGCMHGWLWAERFPEDLDVLVALACQPTAMSGRNAIWRNVVTGAIRNDPTWNHGDYDRQPAGLRTASSIVLLMLGSAREMQVRGPTWESAHAEMEEALDRYMKGRDANDALYQWDSSRSYDPSSRLEAIKARVLAVNSEDDAINPPESGIVEREMRRVPHGRYVLLKASDLTHGHRTYANPSAWKPYLEEVLSAPER
jgi:homoserine O-acetyltransferase